MFCKRSELLVSFLYLIPDGLLETNRFFLVFATDSEDLILLYSVTQLK